MQPVSLPTLGPSLFHTMCKRFQRYLSLDYEARTRTDFPGCLQVLETLVDSVHQDAINHYKSFYSSVIGGITTHPAFMNVPMDDHMVHRGHAVFDTAIVAGGHIYQLDQHVERFMKSAELARIPLPTHEAQVKRIIMDTAAASCCESGVLWKQL